MCNCALGELPPADYSRFRRDGATWYYQTNGKESLWSIVYTYLGNLASAPAIDELYNAQDAAFKARFPYRPAGQFAPSSLSDLLPAGTQVKLTETLATRISTMFAATTARLSDSARASVLTSDALRSAMAIRPVVAASAPIALPGLPSSSGTGSSSTSSSMWLYLALAGVGVVAIGYFALRRG